MLAIVKIFPATQGFPAVNYNMHKVARDDAEILTKRNFGFLETFSQIRSIDFENYLRAISSLNMHTDRDQFHAVISVKRDNLSASALLEMGEKWLEKMGYQYQPYLVFFHKDNANHHIHIVSCNVRIDGSRIDTAFIRIRAIKALHELIGVDREADFKGDISPLLSYAFSDLSQLCSLLSLKGYKGYLMGDVFKISKYGQAMLQMNTEQFSKIVFSPKVSVAHIQRIRSAINEQLMLSSNICSPVFQPSPKSFKTQIAGYQSALSVDLKLRWNIEICYHFSKQQITGFTAIDHQSRIVVPGEEIMDLSRLISQAQSSAEHISIRTR